MSKQSENNIVGKAKVLYADKAYQACIRYISTNIILDNISVSGLTTLYYLLGNAYAAIHMYHESVVFLKKSIYHDYKNSLVHFCLGDTYRELRKFDLAAEAYENAIKLNPNEPKYYLNLGGVYRTLDKPDLAITAYRMLVNLQPESALAYRNLIQCSTYHDHLNQDYLVISAMLEKDITLDEKMHCHFALGKILHASKSYSEAFEHFKMANDIRSVQKRYDGVKHEELINQTIKFFTPEYFRQSPKGILSSQPIFIIGMPRSGKSLMERLLTRHPDITGVDEVGIIDTLIYQLKNRSKLNHFIPDIKEVLTHDNLVAMGHYYLDKVNEINSYLAVKITDTTPCNFKYLGYIALIFPRAKVIHVKRNPVDNCFQIYMKYFAEGNHYAYKFEDLAHYYHCYDKLMRYWQKVLPLDIMEIEYEDIISSTEEVSTKVCKYLELYPNPQYQSDVKKMAITSDEVGQWKHYQEKISPLINALTRHAVKKSPKQ